MCGIIGVINASVTANPGVVSFMKQGLVASQLRGTDSTGMLQVGMRPEEVFVHKLAINSTEYIEDTQALAMLRDVDTSLINVAHVRARTQGAVSDNNAHPFTVLTPDKQRLIGVHNGSLTNWKTQEGGSKYDVDSHWAMSHIATHGKKAFEDIHGPFAMVWWNESEPGKVNIARNSQRPLHIMFNKARTRMVFASEALMLGWIAQRCGFDGDGDVREVPVGKLFTIDTSGLSISWTVEDLPSPKTPAVTTTATAAQNGGYTAIPLPNGYKVFAEQLALLIEGKPTTADATLRYGGGYSGNYTRSYGGNSHYYGGVNWDTEVEDYEDDELPPFTGTGSGSCAVPNLNDELDMLLPESVLPSRRHSKVTEEEVEAARTAGMLGAYLLVEADTYVPRNRQLFCNVKLQDSDHDVVFRNIGKTAGRKLAGDAAITDGVVVGLETDGTIIMAQTTKRVRDYVNA